MIGAILLAAGESTRMGEPKLLMPWGEGETIISHVAKCYLAAGLDQVIVVTGAFREEVELEIGAMPVQCVFNPRFAEEEMLFSLQVGIRRLKGTPAAAALISPADIPDVKVETILAITRHWHEHGGALLTPSYNRRSGHPILIERSVWADVLRLGPDETLRIFLHRRAGDRSYVEVDDPAILRDVDTPEDYDGVRPSAG